MWRTFMVTRSLIVPLTFFLMQHIEWLQQLMFGTLHHAQPGFAFLLKRPEETNKRRKGRLAYEEWK